MKKFTRSNKRIYFLFLFILFSQFSFGQWSTLPPPTSEDLHDVDFIDNQIGVVVGNRGTILKTRDGGNSWYSINQAATITGEVHGVTMIDSQTVAVSTWDPTGQSGRTSISFNSGTSWLPNSADSGLVHRVDLEKNDFAQIHATEADFNRYDGSTIMLAPNISTTVSLDQIRLFGNTKGVLSGLVSGFFTYSAYFYATIDGNNWYKNDVLSYTNSDAHTTMAYSHQDTTYLFTNRYSGFVPGTSNGLIKLWDFLPVEFSPGDTSMIFRNQIVNSNMPAYMNDAHFETTDIAYSLGADNNIYKTLNTGFNWSVDYLAPNELKKMEWQSGVGYAVGNRGTICKYNPISTAIDDHDNNPDLVKIHPNPVKNDVQFTLKEAGFQLKMYNSVGKLVHQLEHNGKKLSMKMHHFPKGAYFLKFKTRKGLVTTKKIIKK